MQRRTIWIIVGSVVGVLLVMCLVIGGVAFFLVRQAQRQQEEALNIIATITSDLDSFIPSAPPDATAIPDPGVAAETPFPATPLRLPDASAAPTAAAAGGAANDVSAALVSPMQAALEQRTHATLYQIDATLDPVQHTITGVQTVYVTNTEDVPLKELYFRLYVNAPHYNEGGIAVTAVEVNGGTATTALEADETALRVALVEPLQDGATVQITMRFTTSVPQGGGGYGIFNESNGVFALYNWHPEVAVYEEAGWKLNPVTEQGDPTNTDASNYDVAFRAPKGFAVITSGTDIGVPDETGSAVVHRSVGALARNFVVVTSDRYEQLTRQVGATKVSSYFLPGNDTGGQQVLDTTIKSLDIFGKAFGSYPYTELDVTQVDLGGGAAGMEATGLVMIATNLYAGEGRNPLGEQGGLFSGAGGADTLAFTTAHEIAHQWWYSVVGSDAYAQPWLDESLTNWSSAYYVDQAVGAEAGLLARDLFISLGYRAVLAEGDQRLDQPVDKFDAQAYGGIVYGKGALMYDVLRAELGERKFFEFLQRYYREQQFDRADSDEWLQTLNAVAGKDMMPFYQKWVEGTAINPDDLPPSGPLGTMLERFEDAVPEGSPAP